MTTRAAVRRYLLNALLDLERVDDAALDEAFRHAQKAAFLILDLRGTIEPVVHRTGGHAMTRAGESPAPTLTLDRPSSPVPPVPPAAPGLLDGGRSTYQPEAVPPDLTAAEGESPSLAHGGNRESGGGNQL